MGESWECAKSGVKVVEKQKMRLDKFLKVSRIIKRRSVANEVCDAGRVTANGRPVKASYNVAVGDEIGVTFGERTQVFRVLSVTEQVGKDAARGMYEVVDDGKNA